jgi:flagellar biosynthesis protein FliP
MYFWLSLAVLLAAVHRAAAQDISINFGQGAGLTERVVQLAAQRTMLSVAPSILVMVTSFTRIVVVVICGERPPVDLRPTTLPLVGRELFRVHQIDDGDHSSR